MEEKVFPELKLPRIELKIKETNEEVLIWDFIRKKYLILTPEEWVRQHFINLLVHHLNYPSSLFKLEREHTYNKLKKRTDIEVLDADGNTFLLVECKAPDVSLNKKTLNQLSVYNATKSSRFVAITNGMQHFVWEYKKGLNDFRPLNVFPDYREYN